MGHFLDFAAFYQIKNIIKQNKTFYILTLLSNIKSTKKYFSLTKVEETGQLTHFTPYGVKWVIFLMQYKLKYFEPIAYLFLFYAIKHGLIWHIKA